LPFLEFNINKIILQIASISSFFNSVLWFWDSYKLQCRVQEQYSISPCQLYIPRRSPNTSSVLIIQIWFLDFPWFCPM
jgi:hypothetical protein